MRRMLFEKYRNGIWISHLDLMRVFQRAFRRAGLPQMERALDQAGLAPSLRPEALSTDDFQRLSSFLPLNLDNPR